MRWTARACALWLAMIAACDTPQAARDEVTCTTLCRCFVTLPAQQDECVTECIGDLGPVSETCSACVGEHADACGTIFDDCQGACFVSPVPLEEEEEEAP